MAYLIQVWKIHSRICFVASVGQSLDSCSRGVVDGMEKGPRPSSHAAREMGWQPIGIV